jgi:XTP/dITP diphosphohydrolase
MRICTTNPGKVREFGGLLSPLGVALVPTMDHDIPETGDTFADNAREKAMGYARLYPGEWLLAEDSGLVVPTLNGLPGAFSARFADCVLSDDLTVVRVQESGRTRKVLDPLNTARVLSMLEGTPPEKRGAYFVAMIVVVNPQGNIAFEVERRTNGWITEAPRGNNGFGYDPVFESDTSFGLTWSEMDTARKDLVSHRSKAVWDLMSWLCSTTVVVV